MATYSAPPDLQTALQACCEKFNEPKQTVLFRRGEAAFGMFLVLEGKVNLDFDVDGSNPLNTSCGPGALVGLPATLTGHNYSMTATVTEDAEVGFISMKALQDLLHSRPEFRQQPLPLQTCIFKLAMAGEQAGFSVEHMISLLNVGLTIEGLLSLIEWRLGSTETSPCSSRWIV